MKSVKTILLVLVVLIGTTILYRMIDRVVLFLRDLMWFVLFVGLLYACWKLRSWWRNRERINQTAPNGDYDRNP